MGEAPDLVMHEGGRDVLIPYRALHGIAGELRRLRRQPPATTGEDDAEDAAGIALALARLGFVIKPRGKPDA